jgi:hypothetical protein
MSVAFAFAFTFTFAAQVAHADPPLGESSVGVTRWARPELEVTPIVRAGRRGPYAAGWQAWFDGMPIDHARFYELVDRPDLARARIVRPTFGVLAIVGGIAAGVLGAHWASDNRSRGVPTYLAGVVSAFAGTYLVVTTDAVSASEAADLAASHSWSLRFAGRF